MVLGEQTLYFFSRLLLKTEVAESSCVRESADDPAEYDAWRRTELSRILRACEEFGIDIRGKTVLDFGCARGAISQGYVESGAELVLGVDINPEFVRQATVANRSPNSRFLVGAEDHIPLPEKSVDLILANDVFEHITKPVEIIADCHRVLRPGGKLLIGTWGWYHPFAIHLWNKVPVPWAQVIWSEKTIMAVCRRVYRSPWYRPRLYELDGNGKLQSRYEGDEILPGYLNRLLIRDFERIFGESPFEKYDLQLVPFSSKWAHWSRVFLKSYRLREYFASYFWAVLCKGA